ncbi:hypothetical protein MIR68_007326 [Amoeboaphelidium protococcarum]|nr:hypothetical protein MIR68_007326 [Amoeboaphelidium protococcarum]
MLTLKSISLASVALFHVAQAVFYPQQLCLESVENRRGLLGLLPKYRNQDNAMYGDTIINGNRLTIAAIFDGHGVRGDLISLQVKNILYREIRKFLMREDAAAAAQSDNVEYLQQGISDAVLSTDRELCVSRDDDDYLDKEFTESGTTGAFVVVINEHMFMGHIGDSLYVVREEDPVTDTIKAFSNQIEFHTVDIKEEKFRVAGKGGSIVKNGYVRVPGKDKILGMSRTLGDCEFKIDRRNPKIYDSQGIISAQPSLKYHRLKRGSNYYILLASDGLFETSDVRYVARRMSYCSVDVNTCDDLIAEWKQNSRDDTTVQIVKLDERLSPEDFIVV